ncbi:MAG: YdcH family protein [Gammaproteobacteria bacterium]|nr:YdcH family protein [Gammaproteobacteria bacterium]
MSTSNVDTDTFKNRIRINLKELRIQHRDLDVAIAELARNPHADQLRVSRLKKQKLRLKDMISRLESQLIPDLNA